MNGRSESNSPVGFVRVILPWLLALSVSLVYALTLNRWISSQSLGPVAAVSGLNWRAELFGPLTYLVTFPFRWLPAPWIPLALNLLAAACAVLSLVCLARSVALLPRDRTGAQRLRLQGRLSLEVMRHPWLPPVFAVLVCALQRTFWEHAITATGEMLNLLLFAWMLLALLEIRLDGSKNRLPRIAFVFGLAAANNWAMLAFGLPFILAALWAAKANPFARRFLRQIITPFNDRSLPFFTRLRLAFAAFNPRLLATTLGCLLAGFSLLLLLPLAASLPETAQWNFWPALRLTLKTDKELLFYLPPASLLLVCLTSLAPAVFMAIRWRTLVGGASGTGRVAAAMFHGLHAFFLVVALCTALDFALSPRSLGVAFPCLPLYYLAALSVGYFSGYFLLISRPEPRRSDWAKAPRRTPRLDSSLAAAVWVLFLGVPALLAAKNLPHILWARTGALAHYAAELERALPPAGAAILSDDPIRLICLQATLLRHGRAAEYLTVDTSLLSRYPAYFDFLKQRFPKFQLALPALHSTLDLTNPPILADWVRELAAARPVYFLSPVLGLVGESFATHPRRLLYRLAAAPTNAFATEPLPAAVLAEDRAYWHGFAVRLSPDLAHRFQPPQTSAGTGLRQWLLRATHFGPEPDRWSAMVGGYYSAALNGWGVELQRAGLLAEAGQSFGLALELNPDNAAAQMNRNFNRDFQAGKPASLLSAEETEARLGKRRSWQQIFSADGPLDEPNACYKLGILLSEAHLPHQAARHFARAEALAPGHVDAILGLAWQLLQLTNCQEALVQANRALELRPRSPDGLLVKGYALSLLKDFEHAISPLSDLLALHTNDVPASLARAFAHLELNHLDASRQDYLRVTHYLTNCSTAWFGLAEIAYRQKDTAAAIKYGELFLKNPTPFPADILLVEQRLAELCGQTNGTSKR